ATTTAAAIVVAPAARRGSDAIDHVVKLAARDRTVRTLLALEHAHEPDLIDPVTDDVERFDQTRSAIGLHVQRSSDGRDRSLVLLGRLGLRFSARRALTAVRARGSVAFASLASVCARLGRGLTITSGSFAGLDWCALLGGRALCRRSRFISGRGRRRALRRRTRGGR